MSARSMRVQGSTTAAVAHLPPDSQSYCDRHVAAQVEIPPRPIAAIDDAAAVVVEDRYVKLGRRPVRVVRACVR